MSISNKIINSLVWSSLERISVQGIQFILGIILARILSPTEYGTISLLMVIIAFLQVFVDSGFSKALIQKQERTQIDLSTVFFFNIIVSIISYLIIWFGSPFIAAYYDDLMLIVLLRVLSLSLFFNALYAIPTTLLIIELNFKSLAKANLISVLVSGVVSIVLAYKGYGIWSLVYQFLIKSILTVIIMWVQLNWKPTFIFSKSSFNTLFPYGSKLLFSSILNTVVNNFSSLFIAKLTSAKDLGFYTRGTQFADVVYGIFSSVLDSVLLPNLAQIQKERDKFIEITRAIIKSAALISIPVLLGLAILSEPLIRVLLTEKWLIAVPIMQIFCVARLITIISGININVLYAIGRTDLVLKQQYVKFIVRIVLLIFALKYGIIYIALAELVSTIIHFFINTYYPSKILNYGSFEQIKDLLPIIFSSLIMVTVTYISICFIENNILKLVLAPVVGIPIYFGLIYLYKVNEFFILLDKFKKLKSII